MNNWFRFEIQIRLRAYSRKEALAQQKACQGRDVCLSNTTGSPNTTPVESDSTTPCQHGSQTPSTSWHSLLHSFSIIEEQCFLKNWDLVLGLHVTRTEIDAVQTFIFVLAHSITLALVNQLVQSYRYIYTYKMAYSSYPPCPWQARQKGSSLLIMYIHCIYIYL